ncbi:MAG: FAD-binding oxidoreductase [Acidimicrobiia bacterium]|nr:FAD-binding oxidoreductase [Acidimicrobiia bacterium]NNL68431.1 FAD-binding oxidoreductase [Acidimicrobiia bacterium]
MLISDLVDVVGFDHCLTDPGLRTGYEVDWTGRYRGHTVAVLRPGSIEELAAVMKLCHDAGEPVVVQGGNTGMVGGGVPLHGELVVSVARLGNLRVISNLSLQAGAGATLAAVQQAAASVGARFGVDTAARESATIGGMIATNAGGMNVVRYGPMGDQLIDAGVVLADGRYVPSLLISDDDLLGHLAGSEGTLAVVAHATLAIGPTPPDLAIAMVEVPASEIEAVVGRVGSLESVFAVELFGAREVELAAMGIGRSAPARADWLVLAECRSDGDPLPELQAAVGDLPAVVATGQREGGELWLFREALTESVARLGVPHKYDVRIPHGALNDLRATVETAAPDADIFLWGHAFSDRQRTPLANVHVNAVGVVDDEAVFDAIETLNGSVAAEHGIGTAKRHRAAAARSDLAELRMLKDRLDPKGLLNPNVLFPPR